MGTEITEIKELPIQSQVVKRVTAEELGSEEALFNWLKCRLPSGDSLIKQWGILSGTKNVANLWLELVQGEITLDDGTPPKRVVNVACVKIKNDLGKSLLEGHQEMDGGVIRKRHRPLSEKMKPGENAEEACLRGIKEELGPFLGNPENVFLRKDSYTVEVQERESSSYPGLMTHYVLHSMEALVKGLPDNDFTTDENESSYLNGMLTSSAGGSLHHDVKAVGVKKHYWNWVIDNPDEAPI